MAGTGEDSIERTDTSQIAAFLERVQALLHGYGLDLSDVGHESAARCGIEGDTPEEFVARLADQYDLVRLDEALPWRSAARNPRGARTDEA